MSSPFEIHVLDASDNVLGDGPLIDVQAVNTVESLDKVGEVRFVISANALRADLIEPGVQFDIYDKVDGYLGRYHYRNDSLKFSAGLGTLAVTADDALVELRWALVTFKRNYYLDPVENVIADLITFADGWLADVDLGIGNTAVNYEGESVLAAVDVLRDRWDQHFRLTPPSTLKFGAMGDDSGIVLTNMEGQEQAYFQLNFKTAYVEKIERKRDANEIYNRIIPLGAGQGAAQLDIELATAGTYTVLTGTNQNGSSYFYIEDADSIAQFGARTRIVNLSQIRQLSNNATDIRRAADALKMAAEAYIQRHLVAKTSYEITVRGLRAPLSVGDIVRLRYKGVDLNGVVLDVDADFYVMDIRKNREATGARSVELTIMDVPDRRTTDQDIMVDTVRDVKALKMHVQPGPYWSENTWLDTINASAVYFDENLLNAYMTQTTEDQPSDSISQFGMKGARFPLKFDVGVTHIHKVRIQFKTKNHYSVYIAAVDFAGSQFRQAFTITTSKNYPRDVYLFIDAVNVTALYGGPWGLSNASETVELDITDSVITTPESIYQTHRIEFGCLPHLGDVTLPNTNPAASPDEASTGQIELNIRIQGTAMAVIAE